jgi:DDE superfamily endonuclease
MIFGFLPQNLKTKAVAVAFSIAWLRGEVEARPEGAGAAGRLAVFRRELYGCFTARADELCELADAVLCSGGPVRCLAALSLAPGHCRGHGALYDAVNCGRIEIARLRRRRSSARGGGWSPRSARCSGAGPGETGHPAAPARPAVGQL